MLPSHRIICPLSDYGILETTRLVIHDNHSKKYSVIQELSPGASYVLRYGELAPHLDYSFKIQVKRGQGWVDEREYERAVRESISPDGIKYLFYPYQGSQHLVVIFQAINRNPGYNYVGTLRNVPAHRLYIKDEYGDDSATRTSYYVGRNRSFDIANATERLLSSVVQDLGLKRSRCIFGGSSKGGFAALYHGYKFGAGSVLAGGPQILLGDFLNSKSEASVHPPILRYLAGDTSEESVRWANGLMEQAIRESAHPHPNVIIHVGEREPHYKNHVLPFLSLCARIGVANVEVETADYATHEELATHFPEFLRTHVMHFLSGKASIQESAQLQP
jgi:accessory secretory protein Asp2